MAEKKFEKTSDAMKGVLVDTIDGLTEVVKKSSKGILTAILEQGSENVGDLLDTYSDKLKEKVKTDDTD